MALTAHDDLRTLACRLFDAAGLQRGRLTGIAWKGEALIDADQVAQQISLDAAREARLVAEAAMCRRTPERAQPRTGERAQLMMR